MEPGQPDVMEQVPALKVCTGCSVEHPLDNYYRNRKCRGGRLTRCKECCRAAAVKAVEDQAPPPAKPCGRCSVVFAADEFASNTQRRDRLSWACKKCMYEMKLIRKYGITYVEYDQMLLNQDWSCAICAVPFADARPVVDHCHATGKVRGVLCDGCNVGLGRFKDDSNVLRSALHYLGASA